MITAAAGPPGGPHCPSSRRADSTRAHSSAISSAPPAKTALAVPGRGTVSPHGVAYTRGRLIARFGTVLGHSSTVPDLEWFAKHLTGEFPPIFASHFDATLDAMN